MKTQGSRYFVELFSVIAIYAVILFGSVWLLNTYPDNAFRIPIALAPMIPALLIPFVVVRQLGRMDELQRRIQLEALGFAFAGTAVLTFGYGFLELVGLPPMGGFVVWPIMAILWIVGLVLANRRFR